ncbi:hypothetical protein KBD08_00370 [Candidatus Babeliales bacterium]|nr:hypothetical protein [Candidatus Babeliales bacterium]
MNNTTLFNTKNLIVISLIIMFGSSTEPLRTQNLTRTQTQQAVIKDPIVDMSVSFPAPKNPPASCENKSCFRAHQGLYNEIVHCIETHHHHVKIYYPHIKYHIDTTLPDQRHCFWVHKKHLAPLKKLDNDLIDVIPNPEYAKQPTVVLTYPWKGFSVGTRFKHLPQHDTSAAFAIQKIDFHTHAIQLDFVPHSHGLSEQITDAQSTRKLFVTLVNTLVDKVTLSGAQHVIPYIWGGSSYVEPYIDEVFYNKDGCINRTGKSNPYSGYDCSEFIMRMAKIAGIYFPWKTSTAIVHFCKDLKTNQTLEDGDIVWTQGHVMIISNIERNEIIEARGYPSGYGCVHRITLSECFDGINTFNDLLQRYYNKQTIQYKDKQGIVSEKTYNIKILKLPCPHTH